MPITRAQLTLAAFTLILIAAIATAVILIVANDDNRDEAPRDLSRDLTAAAGSALTPTPTP